MLFSIICLYFGGCVLCGTIKCWGHLCYWDYMSGNKLVLVVGFVFLLQNEKQAVHGCQHLSHASHAEFSGLWCFRYWCVFIGAWPMGMCCLSLPTAAPVLSCEAATQTEGRPDLAAVTLRRGLRSRASRCRPRSLVDYKSYIDTKLLVARFLEQSSCSMTPDIHELVENIKTVLKSDEEHMEEAITSASFLEQVVLLISSVTQITCFHSS